MPTFTTRVELQGGAAADYVKLHLYMAEEKFRCFIVGDDGRRYRLPPAEYDSHGDLSADQVRELAERAAARIGRPYRVIVTQAEARSWRLEPFVEPLAAFAPRLRNALASYAPPPPPPVNSLADLGTLPLGRTP